MPTDQIIAYRAWSNDGSCFGYGETQQEAEDCLRRILWRIDLPLGQKIRDEIRVKN